MIRFFRICLVLNVQQLLCATSSNVRLLPCYYYFFFPPCVLLMFLCLLPHILLLCNCQLLPSSLLSAIPQLTSLDIVLYVCTRHGDKQGQGPWLWAQHAFSVPIPEAAFRAFCKAAFLCGGYGCGWLPDVHTGTLTFHPCQDREKIGWKNSWVEMDTRRSLVIIVMAKLSSGKINLIYFQLKLE